jgi:hypothetical protein
MYEGCLPSLVGELKELDKSEDQKLLEKYGVERNGYLARDGELLILTKLYEERKADILADIRRLEDAKNPKPQTQTATPEATTTESQPTQSE